MSQMAFLLERDRIGNGFTVGQAAYRLGLTPAQYRALLEEPVQRAGCRLTQRADAR